MTTDRETGRRPRRARAWWFSLLGLALVAIPGFALGLLAGVLWEDPGLILGDLAGDTEEVAWGPEAPGAADVSAAAGGEPAAEEAAPAAAPDVAAAPPPAALPTASRAAAPAATASRAAGGKLSVQVGAFAESRAAEQLADSLRSKGMPAYVSPGATEGGQRWRVRVGPLASREEADRIAERLKTKEKLPTWVLAEDGA